jgi:colanic acid biosynthesis protein WcaH
MFLDKDTFSTVIKNTPLVSIDLIVKNSEEKVLLGKRVNEPAEGYWFVPGGRIYKDERLDTAFSRTVRDEIGLNLKREDAKFYGLYEHFYDNNVFSDAFSTHYVVLAHKIVTDAVLTLNNQHTEYRWFSVEELLSDSQVHENTKDYFKQRYEFVL